MRDFPEFDVIVIVTVQLIWRQSKQFVHSVANLIKPLPS